MATKTFTQLKTQLAQMMGDADSAGAAANVKFSLTEYGNAINFAIETLRERFLIPTAANLTWVSDQYDYDVPGSLVYLLEAYAEAQTGVNNFGPAAGTGLFEYTIPLGILSIKRTSAGALKIHFDKNSVARHFLNQNGLLIRMQGYMYQAALSSDSDVCTINYPNVLLLAKQYLHLSAEGRDAASLMKHLRQWQAVGAQLANQPDDDYEAPGGIWLDK